MKIGDLSLANNVFLAPMAGVTDLPFRLLCRRLGVGMVTGEMVSSVASLRDTLKSKLRGVHIKEPTPRSIQIVGWDPDAMADAARYNVDQGASMIDINMGCPAKKVFKRLAGSALMGDEVLVGKILDKVVAAVDVPVTLKTRTGVNPEHKNVVRIARIAENSGVQCLAVHGRTRACMYRGKAEYWSIRQVKKAVSIPVIVNGDLDSAEAAKCALKYTKADGVMIGRGANGAPWFPGQVASYLNHGVQPKSPELSIQREIILEHLQEIYSFYGSFQGVRIARKHIKWYTQNFPDSNFFPE